MKTDEAMVFLEEHNFRDVETGPWSFPIEEINRCIKSQRMIWVIQMLKPGFRGPLTANQWWGLLNTLQGNEFPEFYVVSGEQTIYIC